MDIRGDLVDEVRRYFVGPYAEDETFDDFPEDRYVSGLLFPVNTNQDQEDMEEMDAGGDDTDEDTTHETRLRARMLQNSIGIKCELPAGSDSMTAEISYARYAREGQDKWKRAPAVSKTVEIDLTKGSDGAAPISDEDGKPESSVMWTMKKVKDDAQSTRVLSVFLYNDMESPKRDGSTTYHEAKILLNERILFQPMIRLRPSEGAGFAASWYEKSKSASAEDRSLNLLFRNRKAFARGYNCSASWDTGNAVPQFVQTEIVPIYDSKMIQFSSSSDPERPVEIDMVEMDEADTPASLVDMLRPLVNKYREWVERAFDAKDVLDEHGGAMRHNHKMCEEALERMTSGLDLLADERHPEIFESFRLANRAMLYQIARHDYALSKHRGRDVSEPDTSKRGAYFWRPFQVAFLLTNLRSMADGESDLGRRDRDMVDLLWFPTGGGKTEAYMALTAFTLILRRLRWGDAGAGTAVIMRYTLRLLTLQQFERVGTLVCALEKIRKDTGRLGEEPFLLGLWIGTSYTPNHASESRRALTEMRGGGGSTSSTPAQLNFCPWCGTDILCNPEIRCDYVQDTTTLWTLVHCSSKKCLFHSERRDPSFAIPVVTVDEDIYRRCPSILISTVDKFAGLAWNPEMSSLFGLVDQRCQHGALSHGSEHTENSKYKRCRTGTAPRDRYRQPDLIVQDELHLISGPLGTIAGLYETAVGNLCTEDGVGPKVVVSTATIRGVEDQVKKLYDRNRVGTFPPPAMDHGDSFFWWYSDDPGRKYVGLSYSHRSMKFVLARVYASLLQHVYEQKNTAGSSLDPYWTLVAYFNSTRELGGALRLGEDDVVKNIRQMINIIPTHEGQSPRSDLHIEELTGRRTGRELKQIRRSMEQDMHSDYPIDMLLATNMISVGVDINRMGLMVIDGQPKSYSEYIQVTGRIGRKKDVPGLVFTVFNPYKPRDLSHYEDFMGSHMVMQKCVEPTGITPFSDKSMDRALHAVLMALVRMRIPRMAGNNAASMFEVSDADVREITEWIKSRYASVQDHDPASGSSLAEDKIRQICDNWEEYVSKHAELVCYKAKKAKTRNPDEDHPMPLITDFGEREEGLVDGFPIETPRAFRDVEVGAKLFYTGDP